MAEDIPPDMMFGLAEIDALVSTETNDLSNDENPFAEMVNRIQSFLDDSEAGDDNNVRPVHSTPTPEPATVDPKLLTYSSTAEAQILDAPMTPLWTGDGNYSSPIHGGNGSDTAVSSPTQGYGDNTTRQQDVSMGDQNNFEELGGDNTPVPADNNNNNIKASSEDYSNKGGDAGDNHPVKSASMVPAPNGRPQRSAMNPNELIAYFWQVLQSNEQIPPVLKTVDAYNLIQNMVMDGGQGLESGITAKNIVALPRVQQFLANVLSIGSPFVPNNSATEPSTPPNVAANGSGQPPVIETVIQRVGGYQAFRERYIHWRAMASRPISPVSLVALNVLAQPDVEEFLRSMNIHIKLNHQQSISLPVNRNQIANGLSQQRQTVNISEYPSGITDAEANAIVQKHIEKYRNHPAAMNTAQQALPADPSKAKVSRSTKPAARKKSSSPTKAPKKIHPNAVSMYKYFGDPVPGEEADSNENTQDQTQTTTVSRQQIIGYSNAVQSTGIVTSVAPVNANHMNNTTQQRLMTEIRELQRLVHKHEETIKTQHSIIQTQQGAMDAQKRMFDSMVASVMSPNNTSRVVPDHNSSYTYPGYAPTLQDRSFGVKRAANVSESIDVAKRRRGNGGFAFRAIAGENGPINLDPDVAEIEGPLPAPRRRSNRIPTIGEPVQFASVKEEGSDGSNDPIESSGSDYIPS